MRKPKVGSDAIVEAAAAADVAAVDGQRVLVLRFIEDAGMTELAMPTLNQGIAAVEATGVYRLDHCVPGPDPGTRVVTYAVFVRAESASVSVSYRAAS